MPHQPALTDIVKDIAAVAEGIPESELLMPETEMTMSYDDAPEHVKLAVEIIRQVELLHFEDDTVMEAALLVIQDTLRKLPQHERLSWRQRLCEILKVPNGSSRLKSDQEAI